MCYQGVVAPYATALFLCCVLHPAAPGGPGALDWIAEQTDGFSGSDLMELCAQVCDQGSMGV
jgi:hypothetical protein